MKKSRFNSPFTFHLSPFTLLSTLLTLLLLTSCTGEKSEEVHFHRFERLLFGTETGRLQEEMLKHREEYRTELLMFAPEDGQYMEMVKGYVSDPVMREVYRVTDSMYRDLGGVEKELGKALNKAYQLCPETPRVERLYTMVSGDFDNYAFRVYGNGTDLCVMLDQYALGSMERFGYFGVPKYLVNQLRKEQIVPDCMRYLAKQCIEWPESDQTLLDYAIAEGKAVYYVEQTMPQLEDSTLLRYTGEQLKWMRDNTRNVWSWLIENKMLYSTDRNMFHNIIDDAPKTNAFGDGSAPRTTDYIGWQIVRAYAKKTGCSMDELMNEKDSQKILNLSGWRPK